MSRPPVLMIAGGANSRFFPFQDVGHKGAFTLLGEALMIRTLRNLQDHGFSKVICVIPPRDADVQFSQQLLANSDLSIEVQLTVQPEAKGMGDAVLHGIAKLTEEEQHRFAVVSAYQLNAGKMLSEMLDHGDSTVLAASTTSRPWEYGIF